MPGDTYRILHFSDIHLAVGDFHWSYLTDKRLLGRLNHLLRRRHAVRAGRLEQLLELHRSLRPDFTVCTGDVTSIGSPQEFAAAIAALEPIRQASAGNFLYLPGNHDAYVAANHAALEQACLALNGGRIALADFPLVLPAGPAELVAIDASRPGRLWMSDGEMTGAVWDKVGYILRRDIPAGRVRLLLGHFPLLDEGGRPLPRRRRMQGADRLLEAAAAGSFQALLAGHIHHPYITALGPDGPIQLCAGSLTMGGACCVLDIGPGGTLSPRIVHLPPL